MNPGRKSKPKASREDRVTLKTIAQRLGLTASTVSATLNDSPAARSISEATKARILEAAREMNYRPNYFARSLRLQRTYTIGVIAEEIGDAYGAMVISGIEEHLRRNNFFFLTVIHRHDPQLLESCAQLLLARGVEGFITTDTSLRQAWSRPTIAVSGHDPVEGVTNITLNHTEAARMALTHLVQLGHRRIAVLIGHPLSSDSHVRWAAIRDVAQELGVPILPELTMQIDIVDSTPASGYPFAKELLARKQPFTALFSFNDISAIGTIWAFREAGLRVPEDISVVGFDDVPAAAFCEPALTTVRQPLYRMGQLAAQTLLDQIEGKTEYVPEIPIQPEFVVRGSTAPASASRFYSAEPVASAFSGTRPAIANARADHD